MSSVLTLISNPDRFQLTSSLAEEAADCLTRAGAKTGPIEWLSEGEALDLPFEGLTCTGAEAALCLILGEKPVDFAAQSIEGRRKKLLVCDMESTIIHQEMIDELADVLGRRTEIAAITEQAMRGELDFEEALTARVEALAGITQALLDRAAEGMTLHEGAVPLIATMKKAGAHCALVSGGFTIFAQIIAERLGFDSMRANQLELQEGRLSGKVIPPILGRQAKVDALAYYAGELGIDLNLAAAVGDGANDLSMLRAAGLGVAFHAKPLVRAAAPQKLDHCDLTGLLFFQGFKRSDFASA